MRSNLAFAAALLAVIVVANSPALAAGGHSHGAGTVELTLNHGRKWPTDEPLRTAMSGIRTELAAVLEGIHTNTLPTPGYERLASAIEAQVDDAVANCKLPEDADAQLHVVLAEILEGIEWMRGAERQAGAVKVVQALDAYGKHFDHAGWRPLGH